MRLLSTRIILPALLLGSAGTAFGQGLPTSQPAILNITREDVKVGRSAAHAKFEAGWPAAYAKAKSPDYYLAYASMTGPSEVWYVAPYASQAAIGDGMKRDAADPVLSAELERLSSGDAEYITNLRVIQAVGRPELSLGAFPELAKVRFTEITWFRVRSGHEADFEAAAKAYGAAAKRAAPTTSFRVYEIIAGVPGPTYLVFSSVGSYAGFDQSMADGRATMSGATPDEMAVMGKLFTEGVANSETQRFRVDPLQSYVPAATRAADPDFWMPKK